MLGLININKLCIFHIFLDNHEAQSKEVLQELENIDGKADQVGIAFVKINDLELVDEYNLPSIPALVYFRYATPIVYQGKTSKEHIRYVYQ